MDKASSVKFELTNQTRPKGATHFISKSITQDMPISVIPDEVHRKILCEQSPAGSTTKAAYTSVSRKYAGMKVQRAWIAGHVDSTYIQTNTPK